MPKQREAWIDQRIPTVLTQCLLWYWVDWLLRFANYEEAQWINTGRMTPVRNIDLRIYFADSFAWGHLVPDLLTQLIPVTTLVFFACRRLTFTWKWALLVGLAIVAAQWVTTIAYTLNHTHMYVLSRAWLIYYFSRFIVVLPGPLAAAAASRIDLSKEFRIA